MVNDMKKTLFWRMKLLAALSLIYSFFLFAVLVFGIRYGLWQKEGNLQIFAGLLFAGLIVFLGIWIFTLEWPSRKQARQDILFVNQATRDRNYSPIYYWSETNREVMEQFQSLFDHKKMVELSLKASQYMALQQQINPHFLYNTLDAIRSDMMIAGEIQLADTIESLSRYFSYTISNMDSLATISEELNNVQDYFHVQEYRFGDRIQLNIINELEDDMIWEQCIPRLTLQPLVENAISHGLEKSTRKGTVTIQLIQTERNLLIHVMDDGEGMDTAELQQLNTRLNMKEEKKGRDRGGIALVNVNKRIKLLSGEEYGLQVFSQTGIGTDVHVWLPKFLKEERNEKRVFESH